MLLQYVMYYAKRPPIGCLQVAGIARFRHYQSLSIGTWSLFSLDTAKLVPTSTFDMLLLTAVFAEVY
jgi:hypothetical protein